VACNKNTLELPPPKDNIIMKEKTCSFDITRVALIKFKQDSLDKEGKVSIEIKNLTGVDINDLTFFIEMCTSAPSINTCNNQVSFIIPELDAEKAVIKELPFKNIQLSTVFINAGIVQTASKKTLLSNVYDGSYVEFRDTTTNFSKIGIVKGVVFADGTSVFRLGIDSTVAYNIEGKFIDTTRFEPGLFFNRTAPGQGFVFSTTTKLTLPDAGALFNNETNIVRFSFQLGVAQLLPSSTQGLNKIAFTLTKQF
jgi:hypothetical protein